MVWSGYGGNQKSPSAIALVGADPTGISSLGLGEQIVNQDEREHIALLSSLRKPWKVHAFRDSAKWNKMDSSPVLQIGTIEVSATKGTGASIVSPT